jgi:hypothetical protein
MNDCPNKTQHKTTAKKFTRIQNKNWKKAFKGGVINNSIKEIIEN